jgi:hypothetical protein
MLRGLSTGITDESQSCCSPRDPVNILLADSPVAASISVAQDLTARARR